MRFREIKRENNRTHKNFYDLNDYLTKSIDTMKGDNIFAEIKDKNNNTVRKDTINNNFNKILYKNST